tara:strand:- start:14364 stop:15227 length:864 start_codon:yes stop_codon:yes gene_type:complete
MFSLITTSFHTLRVGTKKALPGAFCFLLLLLFSTSPSAQPLQKIYSGLDNATSISITQNHIYVVEQGKHRLLKLDHSGKLLDTIGGRGSGNYQFSKPVDVDATNGLKIFVTDYNNRRVQVFDRRGQFLSSLTARNSFGSTDRYQPTEIAVNNFGEVYLVDEDQERVFHFDLDYNLLDEFRIPSEIDKIDDLLVSSTQLIAFEHETNTLHKLLLNGSYNGFIPAEDVQSVAVSEEGLWMIFDNRMEFENGDQKSVEFGISIDAKDVAVQRSAIFILADNALYKIIFSP